MYDVAMLVFAAVAAIGAVLAVLPLLGFDLRIHGRQSVLLEQSKVRPKRGIWFVLLLAVVSLGLSAASFYYFFHPRVIVKIIEKSVDRIVENNVPSIKPCPAKSKVTVHSTSGSSFGPAGSSQAPITQTCVGANCAASVGQQGV